MTLFNKIALCAALALGAGWLRAQTRGGDYPATVSVSVGALPFNPVHAFVNLNGLPWMDATAAVGLDRPDPGGTGGVTRDLPRSSKGELAVNLEWGEIISGSAYSAFALIDLAEFDPMSDGREVQTMVVGFSPDGGYTVFWFVLDDNDRPGFQKVAQGCGTRRGDLDQPFARWIASNPEAVDRALRVGASNSRTEPLYELPNCG